MNGGRDPSYSHLLFYGIWPHAAAKREVAIGARTLKGKDSVYYDIKHCDIMAMHV